jgi:hypothetical protein
MSQRTTSKEDTTNNTPSCSASDCSGDPRRLVYCLKREKRDLRRGEDHWGPSDTNEDTIDQPDSLKTLTISEIYHSEQGQKAIPHRTNQKKRQRRHLILQPNVEGQKKLFGHLEYAREH